MNESVLTGSTGLGTSDRGLGSDQGVGPSERAAINIVTPTVPVVPVAYVKAYYFAVFCFVATHSRYLTIYLQSDGLSASEIGLILAGQRVLNTLGIPFWSALADKTKRARLMVQISLATCFVPFLCLAIPLHGGFKVVPRAAAFWFFALVSGPQACLHDALARAACQQDADRWGRARVYGAISWSAMHLLLGPLMDAAGFNVMFVSFLISGGLLFLVTHVTAPQACGKVRKEVTRKAIMDIFVRNCLFFINMSVVGAGFSMVEGMLFLLLSQMHAGTQLCGLTVVFTVIFELPIFHYAKLLIARLGTKHMIVLGQLALVTRAAVYANMTEAWMAPLIEPLHGVTFALVWAAGTHHVAETQVSGEGLEASAQGLLQVCFSGIGPIIGLWVGGQIFEHVGSRAVYGIFASVNLVMGLAYAVWGKNQTVRARG